MKKKLERKDKLKKFKGAEVAPVFLIINMLLLSEEFGSVSKGVLYSLWWLLFIMAVCDSKLQHFIECMEDEQATEDEEDFYD